MIEPNRNIEEPKLSEDIPHPDLEDQKAGDGSTDRDLREYSEKPSLGYRLKKTWKGENRAGRIIGTVLDIGEQFLPTYASKARDLFQLNQKAMLKDIISRTLGTGGGSIIRVRNEEGKIDKEAIIASVIRLALLVGVIYGAKALGVLDQVLPALGL